MAYTGNSIVDYLKSEGKDSSYSARKNLAAQYGISNYSGTAQQNTQLLNALRNAGTSSQAASTSSTTQNSPTTDLSSYQTAQTSNAVSDALTKKTAAENAVTNYGAYQSKWSDQLNDIYDKIMNREEFSYDVNGDALYQQLKNSAIYNGQLAMQNTVGQASALTGGYGNSYATTAGQQAYQDSLNDLNNQIPELYQLALDRYNSEGDRLTDQYSLTKDMEDSDYQKYADEYDRLVNERAYQSDNYSDERNYAWEQEQAAQEQANWEKEFNQSQSNWEKEYALSVANSNKTSSGSSGSSSSGSSGSSQSYVSIKGDAKTSEFIASQYTQQEYAHRASKSSTGVSYNEYIDNKIKTLYENGSLSDDEAIYLINYYGVNN